MKKTILISMLSLFTLPAVAEIPPELAKLVPAGAQSVRLQGQTPDGKNCSVEISVSYGIFESVVWVYDSNHQMISRRTAQLQVGLRHELQDLRETATHLTAISFHEAEDGMSSASRATLDVDRDQDGLKSVSLKNEEERLFFGFKTTSHETCRLK